MVTRAKTAKPARAQAARRRKTTGTRTKTGAARTRSRKPRLNLKMFRQLLLQERERLYGELEAMAARTARRGKLDSAIHEQDFDDNPGDAATETLERGTDMALERNLHDILEQIEHSLGKIESRTYGVCDLCGGPITERRLKALLYAALCIQCQGRLEER